MGGVVATVVKQDALDGMVYVVAAADVLMGGSAPAWEVDGNAGTNPAFNYIGTTDSQPLVVKTNAIEALRVTANQQLGIGTSAPLLHVEQKSHVSANASGLAQSTFYVETNASSPQIAISYSLPDPCVAMVEFSATARAADGSSRATFKRSGLFYRQASNVQIQAPGWQSDLTLKSVAGYNVTYSLVVGDVNFNVKSPTSDSVRWTGYLRIQVIN